jgi:hypothetical protein
VLKKECAVFNIVKFTSIITLNKNEWGERTVQKHIVENLEKLYEYRICYVKEKSNKVSKIIKSNKIIFETRNTRNW